MSSVRDRERDKVRNYHLDATPAPEGVRVFLAGRLAVDDVDDLMADLYDAVWGEKGPVVLNLAGIKYMDSAAVLTLYRFAERLRGEGQALSYEEVPPAVTGIMKLISTREGPEKPSAAVIGRSLPEVVGEGVLHILEDCRAMLTFLGALMEATLTLLQHPRDVRWLDVLVAIRRTGAQGLPIVGLISFLIGLIIAFMSSLQLKQFGANIYVASLVGVALVRELGPIMTAILVAGRSASAFAAEIGSMKVNEEIDALIIMGFDPIKFLAVPKLIAVIIVVPILTIYSDIFGILGGMIVGITGLDLTVHTYLQATRRSIDVFMLFSSLVKAGVFAFVIAWVGCHRGFRVIPNVETVGEATTSAVVTSILFIVIVDSVFAIVLHYI